MSFKTVGGCVLVLCAIWNSANIWNSPNWGRAADWLFKNYTWNSSLNSLYSLYSSVILVILCTAAKWDSSYQFCHEIFTLTTGGFHVTSSRPCWWTRTIIIAFSLAPSVRPPAFVHFTFYVSRDWLQTTYLRFFFYLTIRLWARDFYLP